MSPITLYMIMVILTKLLTMYHAVYCYDKGAINFKRQSLYHVASNTNVDVIDARYNFSNRPVNRKSLFGIRSRNLCSVLCLAENLFACKGFEFEAGTGFCKLVTGFLTGDYGSSFGNLQKFRTKEVCPVNSTYVPSIRSCVTLMVGKMKWSDGRVMCNNWTSNSHPVILDRSDTFNAVQIYLNSIPMATLTQCKDMINWKIWTSGIQQQSGGIVWQPYRDGVMFPIASSNLLNAFQGGGGGTGALESTAVVSISCKSK
ncbi:hypothetical protein HELRODRAFT_194879 [Helobdella robusta]|uniref:Apple domain-containing protein n=1 Tax=Helobdella robusta TaxID=6412 RepID=T1FWI8_HELRO|nr:hypothetical protein HELRODRAFT_194879 [Helobdella robusta]ESO11177.1 hypothetical protein HELRODRAFT_194879 [Helobdella robusta]